MEGAIRKINEMGILTEFIDTFELSTQKPMNKQLYGKWNDVIKFIASHLNEVITTEVPSFECDEDESGIGFFKVEGIEKILQSKSEYRFNKSISDNILSAAQAALQKLGYDGNQPQKISLVLHVTKHAYERIVSMFIDELSNPIIHDNLLKMQ